MPIVGRCSPLPVGKREVVMPKLASAVLPRSGQLEVGHPLSLGVVMHRAESFEGQPLTRRLIGPA